MDQMNQQATTEEVNDMMQKPCPSCDGDHMKYQCEQNKDAAATMGEKMCPVHTTSQLKDCCMTKPEEHKI